MDIFKFLDVDVESARYADETVEALTKQASTLYVVLGKELARTDTAEVLGMTFEIQQDGKTAFIASAFGVGRIIYSPRIGVNGAYANFEIQKVESDEKDEDCWRKVASFRIARDGVVYDDQDKQLGRLIMEHGPVSFAIAAGVAAALGA